MKYVFILALLLLVACQQSETLEVGVIAPLTGPIAKYGEQMRTGFDQAISESDKEITLVYENTEGINLAMTQTALNKFATQGVVGVLGPYGGSTNNLAGVFADEHQILVLSPGDNTFKQSDYKIPTRYQIGEEVQALVAHAEAQEYETAAILYYNNEWGLQYRDELKAQFSGEVVAAETYGFDNLDVRTQILRIKQQEPDFLLIIDATGFQIIKQVKELGVEAALYSEWEISESPEPAYVKDVTYAQPQKDASITAHLEEAWGREPTVVEVDAYTAGMFMVEALNACPEHEVTCMADVITSKPDFNKEQWRFEKDFVIETTI